MDLRFQPSEDLRQAVKILQMIAPTAVISTFEDHLLLMAEKGRECQVVLDIPKHFFMNYNVAPDYYKIDLKKFLDHIQTGGIVSMKEFEVDVEKATPVRELAYKTSVRVTSSSISGAIDREAEQVQFRVKDKKFFVNGKQLAHVEMKTPGGLFGTFLKSPEVKAKYNAWFVRTIVSHLSRYTTVSFENNSPVKIEYQCLGFRLFCQITPIVEK